jgi:predicted RNA-binding protein YlxR (DUF448 family)
MTDSDTAPDAPPGGGPMRTCIVTGAEQTPDRMIRFVVGPEGDVVPDLGRGLPGRGLWVSAERAVVERAIAGRLFSKAARAAVKAPPELAGRVERLLLVRALEDLGRARRAGRAVAGFVRVEQMIGRGQAGLLVVADAADGDGLGKLRGSGLPIERLGDPETLGGVFGREQAIYVAVAHDDRSGQFIQRIAGGAARWRRYRLNGAG